MSNRQLSMKRVSCKSRKTIKRIKSGGSKYTPDEIKFFKDYISEYYVDIDSDKKEWLMNNIGKMPYSKKYTSPFGKLSKAERENKIIQGKTRIDGYVKFSDSW